MLDIDSEGFSGLCAPLDHTPLQSPNPKKSCIDPVSSEEGGVSNADILKAINSLNDHFSEFQRLVNKNTSDIAEVQENVKGLQIDCQGTKDEAKVPKVKLAAVEERQDGLEQYSRRWNLRLLNLAEQNNEDVGKEVLEIIAKIVPEEKTRLGFLVDTVHRIGRTREDNSARPIIMQFTMRTFKQKL